MMEDNTHTKNCNGNNKYYEGGSRAGSAGSSANTVPFCSEIVTPFVDSAPQILVRTERNASLFFNCKYNIIEVFTVWKYSAKD